MLSNYSIMEGYRSNLNPSHHNDIDLTEEAQKEVYVFCRDFMRENNLTSIVDVGCGSGFKLIKYLNDFHTIGIETEPCFSMLKQKYPNRNWLLSGEQEISFKSYDEIKNSDVALCCDVIEHIVNPDNLIEYLININAKYYIISTPCREILCTHEKFAHMYASFWNGPPMNQSHVREWTMQEFKTYVSTKFQILQSFYCKDQIECQYHLMTKID